MSGAYEWVLGGAGVELGVVGAVLVEGKGTDPIGGRVGEGVVGGVLLDAPAPTAIEHGHGVVKGLRQRTAAAGGGDVGMWECEDVGMWECGDVGMWECGDEAMRR